MVNHWRIFSQISRFIPHYCLLCESPVKGQALCTGCFKDLPWNRHACLRCAIPLAEGSLSPLCSDCEHRPPLQKRALAPLCYDFPVDHLVAGLKYQRRLDHAPELGKILLEAVKAADLPRPDLLLPVPLHPKRLRARGYNQARELARPLAKHWGIPLETQLVQRQRHTAQQMRLSAASRQNNLEAAFVLNPARLEQLGSLRHVLLLDDVLTTGATLNAITTLLSDAGIPEITHCTLARTP